MNPFRDLGHQIESLWSAKAYSYESFPELATKLLHEFRYALSPRDLDQVLAEWFLKSPIPEQVNLHNSFGQPPVTLFNNGKFVVDLYIWLNFDTSLHSHGFRGAFRVLHGSSLQEEFGVRTLHKISDDVCVTELGKPEAAILKAGDVRTIWPGQDLTHRVIHLENPTITLCIKTINEPDLHQWNYFANGLAIQKRSVPESLVKSVYFFQYLSQRDEDEAANFLFELLRSLDISLEMNLYEEIAGGSLDLSEETAHFILETITTRHAKSDWLKMYDAANIEHITEIDFSVSDSPLGRLAAHAVNAGYTAEDLLKLSTQLTGRPPSAEQIETALSSLAAGLSPSQLKSVRKIIEG